MISRVALNLVETTVSIAGKQVDFTRLYLFQEFNAHHACEIEVDHEEFGVKWMESPVNQVMYIEESINIILKHRILQVSQN
jgi:hypothetical protein